jgi:GTP-binding protein HflX
LLRKIEAELFEAYVDVRVKLPYQEGQLISLFHEQGQVESVEHGRGGVVMNGQLPGRLVARFKPFFIQS